MRPRVCLNMIVRDESAVIERCLHSVRPFIDAWVIVDTGSTDDTPARVAAALEGIPGGLHHRPWRNFADNRNEALELARAQAEYLLFIDADETLEVPSGEVLPALDGAAYSFETCYADLAYDRVGLVATRLPWRWHGVVHEYLDAGVPVAQPRLPGFRIRVRTDGARSRDPDKYLKDAALLEAALADDPANARNRFYLAQSYRDAGRLQDALLHYQQRAAQAGWDEETWYARYQCAVLLEGLQATRAEVTAAYLEAWEQRPSRAEPLVRLARHCRLAGAWQSAYLFAREAVALPPSGDRLFVEVAVHAWWSRDELALAAYYTGRTEEAAHLWRSLLAAPALPESERPRIERNLAFTRSGA